MSDYCDHEEYGELEAELEAQVKTTRKWMALHDEAVERETRLLCEGVLMRDALETIANMQPIPGMKDEVLMRGCARAALSEVSVSEGLPPVGDGITDDTEALQRTVDKT